MCLLLSPSLLQKSEFVLHPHFLLFLQLYFHLILHLDVVLHFVKNIRVSVLLDVLIEINDFFRKGVLNFLNFGGVIL